MSVAKSPEFLRPVSSAPVEGEEAGKETVQRTPEEILWEKLSEEEKEKWLRKAVRK